MGRLLTTAAKEVLRKKRPNSNDHRKSYKRLFTIGTLGLTTYNKDTLRVTNQWPYAEVLGVRPDRSGKPVQPQQQRLVLLLTDTNRKHHEMTFASEYRTDVLTDILRFRDRFGDRAAISPRIAAIKYGWSEKVENVCLCAGPISIDQLDSRTGTVVKSYFYKDINFLDVVTDLPGGVAIVKNGTGRIHVYTVQHPDSLIRSTMEAVQTNLGIALRRSSTPLTRDHCRDFRLGNASEEEFIAQAEFVVQKVRSSATTATYQSQAQATITNVSRLLCITDTLLLERDPLSYRAVSAHPLCEIHALVRDRNEPQRFAVEYVRGELKTYFSTDRDALLASLLDAVRASGNRDICIRSVLSNRGLRFSPTVIPASEEVESVHLKFIRQQPEGISFWDVLQRFNANVAYSGLLHAVTQDSVFAENKERLIKDALSALLTQAPPGMDTSLAESLPGVGSRQMDRRALKPQSRQQSPSDSSMHLILLEAQFHALRRLLASKAGFLAFTQLPGMRVTLGRIVVNALRRRDDSLTHAVLDAINALMHPMHDTPDIRQEQLNKASIMSSEPFLARLVDLFTLYALRGTGAVSLCALLDFFTFAICLPYSETSDGGSFDCLLRLVAHRGRALFRLFQHPSLAIVRGASMVMRALIEEGGSEVADEMRHLALTEGALFHHLQIACFTQGKDTRSLALKQLSGQLVALWTEDNPDAQDLLKRMFPLGLLAFLESDANPPVQMVDHLPNRDNLQLAQDHMNRVVERKQTVLYQVEAKIDNLLTHWRLRVGLPLPKPNPNRELEERPVVLRLPRHQLQSLRAKKPGDEEKATNWRYFFYQFHQDHAKPDLMWNLRTRSELREAMDKELHEFRRERDYFAQSTMEHVMDHLCAGNESVISASGEEPETIGNGGSPRSTDSSTPTTPSSPQVSPSASAESVRLPQPPTAPPSPTRVTADRLMMQAGRVSWNHSEFKVEHPSLASEPRVGDYYLRLLLEEDKRACQSDSGDDAGHVTSDSKAALAGLSRIRDSKQFFNDLFRRYLQYVASGPALNAAVSASAANTATRRGTRDSQQRVHRLAMRCLCLHAMSVVYGRCHDEIGPVSDIPLLVYLLDRTCSAPERDCLLLLLNKLMLNRYNVDALVDADGVRVLVDLACLAHLHTSRAPTAMQSNVIKASSTQESSEGGGSTQREWWWYSPTMTTTSTTTVPGQQQPTSAAGNGMAIQGPVSFNELRKLFNKRQLSSSTLVYAQGLDAMPRCRPDGFLAADDDHEDDDDSGLINATGAKPTEQPQSGVVGSQSRAALSNWVAARRVIQLRWTTPELLLNSNPMSSKPNLINGNSLSANEKQRNTSSLASGTEGVGSLIDQLGYSQGALLDYTTVAMRCVDVLRKLCDSCSSRDPRGGVVRPLPRPRRVISDPQCLTHLSQLLLTFDPPLVERVVSLLHILLDQNPSLPRLYLTGMFFFILMYTGSNVLPITRFLKDVHLVQAFRVDPTTRLSNSDLSSRSILGNMLPDAMVAYLENHSADKFAEIFLGNFDSPEAIWNAEMRRFLIERIASHLADFTPRLHSNTRAIYQFLQIPVIVYPQLENELFCHNYYLRHLCDTNRFPNWPIRDPIALLRDVLQSWRAETEKKPLDMSFADAVKVLGLDATQLNPSNEEALIRRAYYHVSMKYHPDKNPEGRDIFHAATVAYQFLCNRSKLGSGPNRMHIQLMLRTQSIVYERYRTMLSQQKYSGYPMLVQTIRQETEDPDLFSRVASSEDWSGPQASTAKQDDSDGQHKEGDEGASKTCPETAGNAVLLVAATELAYETVATSALNAEQLRREGGIQVLQETFARCSVLLSTTTSRPNDAIVRVCGHVVSVLAAASQFPSCRQSIQELPQLARHVLRLLYYRNLPQLCCLAASCSAAFCRDYWLCVTCYEYGGLYLLLRHVFAYDFTLEEGGVESEESTNAQVATNRLALLSLWAIGRLLNGYHSAHEAREDMNQLRDGPEIGTALARLLTPHLQRKITELAQYDTILTTENQKTDVNPPVVDLPVLHGFAPDTTRGKYLRQLAKLLTTNSVTPYLIWDNRCRAELEVMLDANIQQLIRTGECDLDAATRFVHTTYSHELLIGEVFVRLYNKQPSYPLENPKGFADDLLDFIGRESVNISAHSAVKADYTLIKESEDGATSPNSDSSASLVDILTDIDWASEATNLADLTVSRLCSALEALNHVIRHNSGVELQCMGKFSLIFSVMDLHGYPDLQIRALEVVQAVSVNNECLTDLASAQLLVSMVMLLPSLPQCHQLVVETLDHLVTSTGLLKEIVYSGGLLYLLEVLIRSPLRRVREAVVSLFSHCLADKQVGRRIQALLGQYLPAIFPDTMRDTAEAFLNLFDSDHDNPELIWNQEMRDLLSTTLNTQAQLFYTNQSANRRIRWSLPDSFHVPYEDTLMRAASERIRVGANATEEEEMMASLGPVVVAGVYLHSYVASPGWVLRRPEIFLDALMEHWIETARKLPETALLLRLLTRACVTVLVDRPGLVDALPRKGYLHRIIDLLAQVTDPEGAKAAVLLLHRMSTSKVCVQSMADRDTIGGLMHVVNCCIGEELGLVGETLFGIFDSPNCDPLIAQALKHDLIGCVLQLLHNGLPRSVREPGQTCAYLVKALKAMQRSTLYGSKVTARLDAHPNWAEYRDQGHALFLSNTSHSTTAYLTAGSAAGSLHAGYLTAEASNLIPAPIPTAPPPPPPPRPPPPVPPN